MSAISSLPGTTHNLANAPSFSVPVFLVRVIAATYTMQLIVNGAMPQLEMLVLGGKAPVTTNSYIALLVWLGGLLLLTKQFQKSPMLPVTLVISAYAVGELIILPSITKYTVEDIRVSFGALLIPIVVVGLVGCVPVNLDRRSGYAIISGFFAATFLVSCLQYVTGDPILPTSSSDGNFYVSSYSFNEDVRAFSLFHSGLEAGIFYCFIGCIGMSLAMTKRKRFLGYGVLLASGFACFTTLTRLVLLGFVVSVSSVFLMKIRRKNPLVLAVPLLWLAVSGIFIVEAGNLNLRSGGKGLSSGDSLNTRLSEWGIYSAAYLSEPALQQVFGAGVSPWRPTTTATRPETAALVSIDNTYLETLLNCGVIGLVLISIFYWHLWKRSCLAALRDEDHVMVGVAGMLAALPFFACVNDFPNQILMMSIFASMVTRQGTLENPSHSSGSSMLPVANVLGSSNKSSTSLIRG